MKIQSIFKYYFTRSLFEEQKSDWLIVNDMLGKKTSGEISFPLFLFYLCVDLLQSYLFLKFCFQLIDNDNTKNKNKKLQIYQSNYQQYYKLFKKIPFERQEKINSQMKHKHQPVLTEQANLGTEINQQNNQIYIQEIQGEENRFEMKFGIFMFILAFFLAASIFLFQQYQDAIYDNDHQPQLKDLLKSQSSKSLQETHKQQENNQEQQMKTQNMSQTILLSNLVSQNKDQPEIINGNKSNNEQSKYHQENVNAISSVNISTPQHANEPQVQTAIYKLPILPELMIPQSQRKVTVVFTTCCYRYDLLQKTLESFFQVNTFTEQKGLQEVIVVHDGPATLSLENVMKKYPNINWIISQQKVGQIIAIDLAYQQVTTPFVFHSQDDWQFLHENFIQIGFDYFQRIPNLLQTWIKITNNKVNPRTRIVQTPYFGFSFNPGLKKMEHYGMLQQGYKWITKNVSYKKGAGRAESFLSRYYTKKGFVVAQTEVNYIKHTGEGRGQSRA